jgi:hypothetical protein
MYLSMFLSMVNWERAFKAATPTTLSLESPDLDNSATSISGNNRVLSRLQKCVTNAYVPGIKLDTSVTQP